MNFIEANGNGLWENLLTENDIWINQMELRGDKLYIDAKGPKELMEKLPLDYSH